MMFVKLFFLNANVYDSWPNNYESLSDNFAPWHQNVTYVCVFSHTQYLSSSTAPGVSCHCKKAQEENLWLLETHQNLVFRTFAKRQMASNNLAGSHDSFTHLLIPDLPVPYLFGTNLPVANISGNHRPLFPNIYGTGRKMRESYYYRKVSSRGLPVTDACRGRG